MQRGTLNHWGRWKKGKEGKEKATEEEPMMWYLRLIASDFFVSLLWGHKGRLLQSAHCSLQRPLRDFRRFPIFGSCSNSSPIVIVLSLKKKDCGSSSMRIWISSSSKVILHLLGSDITGGVMNPATAFGWAYAQGTHVSKEHIFVYWLAPIEATVLGAWACSLSIKKKMFRVRHGRICAMFKLN